MKTLKNFLLDLFFPKHCFGCQKEGTYLCQDCQSILDIIDHHKQYKTKYLDDLYFPLSYKKNSFNLQNNLTKKLIKKFKYKPFIKQLSDSLSDLIITHFKLCEKQIPFLQEKDNFIITFVPLSKTKLRWRGFNQAQEIAKNISLKLEIPYQKILRKEKRTLAQAQLSKKKRIQNLKNSFSIIQETNKNVLLVDDIYTTGTTINECTKELKKSGVKKVIGITIARTEPN
jgi:competence protein ComFC